jgi:acetolactate synthase-1/2/3 large subunit
MTVSEYIFDYLKNIGVKDVFYVSGGMCMYLVDALHRSGINPVAMLHEQSAAVAADAYAQITGNLGVCLVTAGPGSLNAVTGCAASYIDSTPVIFISGQCKSADLNDGTLRQRGVQEVDIVSMVKGITKWQYEVTKENVKDFLCYAVNIAKKGRPGPVWLSIPLDVQAAEI